MVNKIDIDQTKLDKHRDHYLIRVAYLYNSFQRHRYHWNMMKPSTKKMRIQNKYFIDLRLYKKQKISYKTSLKVESS